MRAVTSLAFVLLAATACGSGDDNKFGGTIPGGITTQQDAIDYVRSQEKDGYLYNSGGTKISTSTAALEQKELWAAELRKLFDRWDLCEIDIAWDVSVPDKPAATLSYDGSGNDPFGSTFISPGCDRRAVEDDHD